MLSAKYKKVSNKFVSLVLITYSVFNTGKHVLSVRVLLKKAYHNPILSYINKALERALGKYAKDYSAYKLWIGNKVVYMPFRVKGLDGSLF